MIRTPMTSGELAKAAGVNVETLRFYERRRLLPKPRRTSSGHRRYDQPALERLQLIHRAQELGFSLPQISVLIAAFDDPEALCEDVCAQVQEKIDHVDRLLSRLRHQRKRLVSLRDACPQVRPLRDCPVVEELTANTVAGKRRSR